MTNEEYIRQHMPLNELAILIMDADAYGTYATSDGKIFYDYDEALDHEIEWLNSERLNC